MLQLIMFASVLALLIGLFFLFLPVGWSKHWLTSQSLVGGVLVDYLMPDLWFQDLLAATLILALIRQKTISVQFQLFSVGLGLIFLQLGHSPWPPLSLIQLARLLLALSLASGLNQLVQQKPRFRQPILLGLSLSNLWVLALSLGQLIKQKTVLGWWFLGEPLFSPGLSQIKTLSLLGHRLITPLATFPHSNVLAAFALFSFLRLKKSNPTGWIKLGFIASGLNLLLSGSIFTQITALISLTFDSPRKRTLWLGWIILIVLIFGLQPLQPLSWKRRQELISAASQMIKTHPFWGVGWGFFVAQLPRFWPAQLGPRFLQPVHHLFLLILSELGLVGSLGLALISRALLRFRFSLKSLLPLLLLASFDHYFWTTTQGVYLFWLWLNSTSSAFRPSWSKATNLTRARAARSNARGRTRRKGK